MKLQTPYQGIKDNKILTKNGDCWAYFHIPPRTVSDNDKKAKESYKRDLELVFKEIGRYPEFHLQIFPQDLRLRERFNELEKDFDPEMLEIGKRYNERTISLLKEELHEITGYSFLVGVKLKRQMIYDSVGVQANFIKAVDDVTTKAFKLLHLNVETTEKDFLLYKESEESISHFLGILQSERVKEEMLFFLIRKNFIRGFEYSYEEETNREINISDTVLDPSNQSGVLHLQGKEGKESYISFLMIAQTDLDLSYIELFDIVQGFSFPLEFHIKGKTAKKTSLKRKIMFTSQRFKETDIEMYQNEDEDESIVEGKYHLNKLRNELDNENIPFFDWLASFVVTAKTKKELHSRIKTVRTEMQRFQIQVVQPLADQLPLFYKFLHGQSLELKEPNWLQSTTSQTLAEFSIGLSHQLGSYIGNYFGRVTKGNAISVEEAVFNSREIVLFHSFLAHEGIEGATTDSPHISITGDTGTGKSFLTKMMFFYACFLKGQVLMTDPKAENKKWFIEAINNKDIQENFPEFIALIDKIHFVTLDPDNPKNHGVLDPLHFLSGSKAKDTILTILDTILQTTDLKTENEIREIVEAVLQRKEQGENIGMLQVVEGLYQSSDERVREVAKNFTLKIQNSALQLLFSNGENRGISVNDKITILEIEGLDLPEVNSKVEEQSESERHSIAVMIALAKFCEHFGMRDKSVNTSLFFDEAWTLTTAKGGKKLTKSMKRVGRSYSNQSVIITQSVTDLGDKDDTGNFGAGFFFDGDSEREAILKTLDMEVNESNLKELDTLKKGQCIFRDFYGRKAQLSIDCLFPEWVTAFKTVEKSHSGEAERRFSK